MILIAIFFSLILLYGLTSKVMERTVITAPILFTMVGVVVAFAMPDLMSQQSIERNVFLYVAELGLVLLLFSDATGVSRKSLKSSRALPIRLLSIGMLLTIVLGALVALIVFPGMSIWEAGILAAILAPTDAGLGQVIVKSEKVPLTIRQALNVEAGLNDGLSVPFLLFFIALAGNSNGAEHVRLVHFMIEQLGYGTVVGLVVGGIGGVLIGNAVKRNWIAPSWQQLSVVTLPLLCLLLSEPIGASMFIAAFVAGLAVQFGFEDAAKHSVEFAEGWGQLFNLSVFFLFGMLIAHVWDQIQLQHVVYAVLSLTVIRMLPVAISLIGTKLNRATILFMGWFGPRGLASIVLGLVYLEHQQYLAPNSAIKLTVMITVFLSIILHGLTAQPGAAWYAKRTPKLDS